MTQTIDNTLAERGSRYGEFDEHAAVTQAIKVAMSLGNNWLCLDDDMKEALEMVAHKVGRILNGDPDYIDSWTDIVGYVRLVEKRLIAEQQAPAFDSNQDTTFGLLPTEPTGDPDYMMGLDNVDESATECQCSRCTAKRHKEIKDWVNKIIGARSPGLNMGDVEDAIKVLLEAGVISVVEDGDA